MQQGRRTDRLAEWQRAAASPLVRRVASAVVAVVAVAIAVWVRAELAPLLRGATYMPFFLAVIFGAWAGGLFGGLIAVVLSALASMLLFLSPAGSMALTGVAEKSSLALFCFTATVICLVAEAMHRARARVEQQAAAVQQAQVALRVRDEQMELALEVGRIVTWDHNLDSGETRHSDSARVLLGRQDLSAQNALQIVHPEDRERIASITRNVLAGGEAHRVEVRVQVPELGTRWFSVRATLRVDAQTGERHLTGLASDISDRKQAELALGVSEDRFRTLAETIPQLAWIAHPDGDIYWFNQRWYEYTGTTFEQMKDGGWGSVHDPDLLPQTRAVWEAAVRSGMPTETTFPLRSADGSYRLFLAKVMPLKDEHGKVLQWFGTNTDVSELHALQDQLKIEDRRKDEFLATLAHELRNPLAPLVTGLDLLDSMHNNAAALQGVRKIMQRQLQRMSRLLDDLLDVGRITRGAIELRKQLVSLTDAVSEAIEASQPVIEQGGHRLERVPSAEPIWLFADAHRLTQIFSNLLNNAARYTDPGGLIRVVVEREGREARVRVIDNGIGLSPEAVPHLFKMFSQIAPGTDRSRSGLGIGLSLVLRLVELHDGKVSVHSEGVGKGSEFVVHLPVADSPAPVDAATLADSHDGSALSRVPPG